MSYQILCSLVHPKSANKALENYCHLTRRAEMCSVINNSAVDMSNFAEIGTWLHCGQVPRQLRIIVEFVALCAS